MTHRKRLIQDPDMEKIEISMYLVNNLSLAQMLSIENMVRSGQLKKIIEQEKREALQIDYQQ